VKMRNCVLFAVFLALFFAFGSSQTINPNNTLVWGSGLTTSNVGIPAYFFMQAQDSTKKNVTTCTSSFSFALTDGVTNYKVQQTCLNGLYTQSYIVKLALTYSLTIYYNSVPLTPT